MITVKTYSSIPDAELDQSFLSAAGVKSYLADENAAALGFGPVIEVRLQVADSDASKAMAILKIKKPKRSLQGSEEVKDGLPKILIFVVLFILIVGALVFVLRKSETQVQGSSVDSRDDNQDGNPDRIYLYQNGLVSSGEMDCNFDGKMDYWEEYDVQGNLLKSTADANFDGRVDEWVVYVHSRLSEISYDTDFSGVPDVFISYENSLIKTQDVRPNASKVVSRRFNYEHGVLKEELVDEDQNGSFDYEIAYDAFLKPSDKKPIKAK